MILGILVRGTAAQLAVMNSRDELEWRYQLDILIW
jgi:hypothetical protein